jgi:hypothetical protein
MKTDIIKILKSTLLLITVTLLLSSCTKEEWEPRIEVEEPVDTVAWQTDYDNGGTLTNTGNSQTNPLVGTKWVLTKMVSAFATEYPNDTITFVGNDEYTYNTSALRPYVLGIIPSSSNYELTFNYFAPFGGSHYSAQVGYYFVDDGEMSNIEFTDVQNNTSSIRAWFIKIQ